MGAEMYDNMSALQPATPVVQRGMALHKMIRTVTMALGGEAYLTFMGNEFGHPEWMDFPREGNGWSYAHCRRQWDLVDAGHLRYSQLNAWDAACLATDAARPYISDSNQWATMMDDERQVLVAERGSLVFVFNFSPYNDYEGLEVPTPEPGTYRVVLDSDEVAFGGQGRIGHDTDHFTQPAGTGDVPGESYYGRGQFMKVLAPSRTVVAYAKHVAKPEPAAAAETKAAGAAGAGEGKAASKKATKAKDTSSAPSKGKE